MPVSLHAQAPPSAARSAPPGSALVPVIPARAYTPPAAPAWCAECRITPADARLAHVDVWTRKQPGDGAADSSVVRRISAVSSWYKYMIANTAGDPAPLATRNPAVGCALPGVDQDYSPTVGLSEAEADRLITAAENDTVTVGAFVRVLLTTGLRVRVGDERADRGSWLRLRTPGAAPLSKTGLPARRAAPSSDGRGRRFAQLAVPPTRCYVCRSMARLIALPIATYPASLGWRLSPL